MSTSGTPSEIISSSEPLHVLDLRPLYTKPAGEELIRILKSLSLKPASFRLSDSAPDLLANAVIDESGIPHYLTNIIKSSLEWIDDDELKEEIWGSASRRLAERSGRSAAPSLTRSFTLPGLTQNDTSKTISIYEPTLTADNLGHKTWSSSYILSLHLPDLSHLIPPIGSHPRRVLELGSGTGLFGISFAALYSNSHVKLTDLPDIVPNLTINANKNVHLAEQEKSTISVEELDWNTCCTLSSTAPSSAINDTVLAADPIYSPSHPTLLTHAISANLCRGPDARLILGLPVRKAYLPQINEIWCLLFDMGLSVLEDGELHGTDDWTDAHGERVSVRVKWAVWAWKEQRMKA